MKPQRWLACRKVFVPWEMPRWWWYVSAILTGLALAWLTGCAAHKHKPELTGTLGPIDVWNREDPKHPRSLRTGAILHRSCVCGAAQCSCRSDHHADTYCVREELP